MTTGRAESIGISVITVTLNERDKLKSTIDSVRLFRNANTHLPIEHIIVDGGSSDGTLDILGAQVDPNLKYISEADRGIYHAMNKGVQLARLAYVVFINAGDIVDVRQFEDIQIALLEKGLIEPKVAGYAFDAVYKIGVFSKLVKSRVVDSTAPIMPGLHQGMLYKRALLSELPFDESFRICGDYEQYARMFLKGFVFKTVDTIFSTLYAGGISTNQPYRLYMESTRITRMYFKLPAFHMVKTNLKLISALLYVQIMLMYSRLVIMVTSLKNNVRWK